MSAARYRLPPTLLPEGEERQLWVLDGRFTTVPQDAADALPGRYALPGLVDAHAHVSITHDATLDAAGIRAALVEMADAGVLVVRDVGSPRSVTLEFVADDSLPTFIAAGRWHAPEERFFADLHDPVPESALVAAALAEVGRGARWVKIIGDWTTPALNYDADTVAGLVRAVHDAGARVAAHTQWEGVAALVAAGVDSVEHGSLLDRGTLEEMARRGTAWTPTLAAFTGPLPDDATPEARARRGRWLDSLRAAVPMAAALGVPILTGTDTAGTVVQEVGRLVEFGLTPVEALRAASTGARAFLGAPGLEECAPADVVTFDEDPREDPSVLARPAAIVRAGRRLR